MPHSTIAAAGLSLVAAVCLGTALAYAADALVIDKDTVKIGTGLQVGPEQGVSIQGTGGRNVFQDSEKAGSLRVGAVSGIPGIYSEKGDVVVGSQSGKIQLKGAVEAGSIAGKGAVPVGAILMWSGSPAQVPDGWVLCDGGNGTPDLSGRFVVGMALGDEDYGTIGKTGGEAKHKLLTAEFPGHVHQLGEKIEFAGQHRHNLFGANPSADNVGTLYAGRWDHQQNTGPVIATQEATPHENRPPYYVLAYIMYKGFSVLPGTYLSSCRKAERSGETLKAECRQPNGSWKTANLDLKTCKAGDISNMNGELTCPKK